jgi:hypothetical protein
VTVVDVILVRGIDHGVLVGAERDIFGLEISRREQNRHHRLRLKLSTNDSIRLFRMQTPIDFFP